VTERSICACVRTIGTEEFLSSIHSKTPTAASRAHGRTTEALRSPRGCPKAHTQLLTSWPAHTRAASKGQSPPCAAPSESVKAVKDRAKMQTKCQTIQKRTRQQAPPGRPRTSRGPTPLRSCRSSIDSIREDWGDHIALWCSRPLEVRANPLLTCVGAHLCSGTVAMVHICVLCDACTPMQEVAMQCW